MADGWNSVLVPGSQSDVNIDYSPTNMVLDNFEGRTVPAPGSGATTGWGISSGSGPWLEPFPGSAYPNHYPVVENGVGKVIYDTDVAPWNQQLVFSWPAEFTLTFRFLMNLNLPPGNSFDDFITVGDVAINGNGERYLGIIAGYLDPSYYGGSAPPNTINLGEHTANWQAHASSFLPNVWHRVKWANSTDLNTSKAKIWQTGDLEPGYIVTSPAFVPSTNVFWIGVTSATTTGSWVRQEIWFDDIRVVSQYDA